MVLVHIPPMGIGEMIAKARDARDMTQGQLAAELGVGQASVSKWETGQRPVPPKHFGRISELLGIPLEKLHESVTANTRPSASRILRVAIPQMGEADLPILTTESGIGGGFRFVDGSRRAGVTPRPATLRDVSRAYAVYMRGDAYAPRIKNGELCYINPDRPPRVGDDVLVQLSATGLCYIAELIEVPGANAVWTFRHTNPPDEFSIPAEDVEHVHVIVTVDRYA